MSQNMQNINFSESEFYIWLNTTTYTGKINLVAKFYIKKVLPVPYNSKQYHDLYLFIPQNQNDAFLEVMEDNIGFTSKEVDNDPPKLSNILCTARSNDVQGVPRHHPESRLLADGGVGVTRRSQEPLCLPGLRTERYEVILGSLPAPVPTNRLGPLLEDSCACQLAVFKGCHSRALSI